MTKGDLLGNLVIKNTSKCIFGELFSRVSRSATLDLGCVISHYGTSHGDRVFAIVADISETQATTFKYIQTNSTSVLVAIPEGLFLGAISDSKIEYGKLKATILIKSKETA